MKYIPEYAICYGDTDTSVAIGYFYEFQTACRVAMLLNRHDGIAEQNEPRFFVSELRHQETKRTYVSSKEGS